MTNPESNMESINLQNFNEQRLGDAGELGLNPLIQHPIHLELGNTVLQLERISSPGDVGKWPSEVDSLFSIKNLSTPNNDGVIIMHNGPETSTVMVAGREINALRGPFLVVGTETTPELGLPRTVSRRHLQIRIGTLQKHLHFMDLYSANGTIVHLGQHDARGIDVPRKAFERGTMIPMVQKRQRWDRNES